MGSGVARQCSRNRCLARWIIPIPRRGRGGAAGRANSKKDLVTGPIRGFCALQALLRWRKAGREGAIRSGEYQITLASSEKALARREPGRSSVPRS
jgi:hypothetical protein